MGKRKLRERMVNDALENWTTLNEKIVEFTEDEVIRAMELENEREGGPRETFVRRLTQRLRGIMAEEFRAELKERVPDGQA